MKSTNKPTHHVDPADPRLSLKTDASVDSSTSPNSNDPFADSIFDNHTDDIWGDGGDDGWDDPVVTEVQDRNSNQSTTKRVESLPQKQNITTASPDVRGKTNNDSQNGNQGNIEMTTKNVLTSNQVDEHTERISTNSNIDETTGKLRNNSTTTSLNPLPFERLRHPKRIETNSASTNVTPNEGINNRKGKIENTNLILINK